MTHFLLLQLWGGQETGSGPLTLQPGPDGIGVPPGLGVQGLQLQSGR